MAGASVQFRHQGRWKDAEMLETSPYAPIEAVLKAGRTKWVLIRPMERIVHLGTAFRVDRFYLRPHGRPQMGNLTLIRDTIPARRTQYCQRRAFPIERRQPIVNVKELGWCHDGCGRPVA